jgi:hypothetical protein
MLPGLPAFSMPETNQLPQKSKKGLAAQQIQQYSSIVVAGLKQV